jgi:hypothetical protein
MRYKAILGELGKELIATERGTCYQLLFAHIVIEEVRKCRGGQDRTADLLVPNQAPYRWATPRNKQVKSNH